MSPKAKSIPQDEVPDEIVAHTESKEPPKSNSPEWNAYVLGLLEKEELVDDKYPTTDGLRRVADILYGEVNIDTRTTQAPGEHNGMVAVAESFVETLDKKRYIREIADAHKQNTDHPYSKHLTAVAGTRAEGRALRKFLRLRKIITAEEANSEGAVVDTTQRINGAQAKMIDFMSKKFDLNGWDFVRSILKEKEPNKVYSSLNEISYENAQLIVGRLNEFQQKNSDNETNPVPEAFKGYDSNLLSERWKV